MLATPAARPRPASRAVVILIVALWVVVDAWWVAVFLRPPALAGIDAFIYVRAAAAWLAGGDPWQAEYLGYAFAAPPPTLVAYAPFALLPEVAAVGAITVACAVAIVLTVRVLRFPFYWVLFPPFVNAVLPANPDSFLVLILLGAPWYLRWLAPLLKVYAIVPMLGSRDLRSLLLTAGILAMTVLVAPWGDFLARSNTIGEALVAQSTIPFSAWGHPALMVLALVALVSIGSRRALWLAVPAIWPSTQFHYSAIASPVARPLVLAVALALPFPFTPVVGVILFAVIERLQRRWSRFDLLTRSV